MRKLICLPCEIEHREFDSKLILANRLAQRDDVVVLLGYDKYFGQILRSTSNCFLLDKSMSTIMLKGRLAPCKERSGIVFINDEEGVNDLDETPEALDIRADKNSIPFVDKYLAWGLDDAKFFAERKLGLGHRISVFGSHRYDLLNSIGFNFYEETISSIKNLFGDYILFNDNLAVDHFDKSYNPPTKLFKSDKDQQTKALSEWDSIVADHKDRRERVREFIINLAASGLNIVVRPHPVYDSLFWHESFRLTSNIHTIYNGCVEPWIHASRAVVTTGCTTGLQALLACKPSFELDISNSKAFSSSLLPKCSSSSDLSDASIFDLSSTFANARKELQTRWRHEGSSTLELSELILGSISSLNYQSSFDWLSNIQRLTPQPPKWRGLTYQNVIVKQQRIHKVLSLSSAVNCKKISDSLFAIYKS